MDGNELIEFCNPNDGDAALVCNGFVMGAEEMNSFHPAGMLWCVPAGVTSNQMAAVLIKYLGENPEKRHWSSAAITTAAFRAAFPCRPAN